MRMLAAGVITIALAGSAVAPGIAQSSASHSTANRVKVFAEPG